MFSFVQLNQLDVNINLFMNNEDLTLLCMIIEQ